MKETPLKILCLGERQLVREFSLATQSRGMIPLVRQQDADDELIRLLGSSPVVDSFEGISLALELTVSDLERKRDNLLKLEAGAKSGLTVLSSSLTCAATTQAAWIGSPERLIGIAALPGQMSQSLLELAPSIHTSHESITRAEDFAVRLGKEVAVVQDRVGLVLPRVVCSLVNEAFFAVMEGIASPEDIDTAMKLGTNYPLGPIEWGNKIGLLYVVSILDAIHRDTGEDRYRVCPLLRQMSASGRWWGG